MTALKKEEEDADEKEQWSNVYHVALHTFILNS